MRIFPTVLSAAFIVTGCSQAEPRGQQYFEANIDEARQVDRECSTGETTGDECRNAAYAISTVEAKERSKKFFGDGKAYDPRK